MCKLQLSGFWFVVVSLTLTSCSRIEEFNLPSPYRDDAQHLLAQGLVMLRQGDISGAQSSFLLARELLPQDPRAYDGLGAAYLRRADKRGALSMFQKAIVLDSNYAPAYAHLAFLAENDGDFAAADELYRLSLEKGPLLLEARSNYSAFLCRLAEKGRSREINREGGVFTREFSVPLTEVKRPVEDECIQQRQMTQALLQAASGAVKANMVDEQLYDRKK
ncbi:MAG: hypothetical protein PHC51_11130 [bacterium]|nr:hypothetical protein [bacterium]